MNLIVSYCKEDINLFLANNVEHRNLPSHQIKRKINEARH